tara:strand:+ start:258 stop:452 length:195 start_codon:yes stop_codon:yes gene_type:complete
MRAIGTKVNITDKEHMLLLLTLNTLELGCMANIMGLEHSNGQMDQYIKVNGKTVVKTEMGSSQE